MLLQIHPEKRESYFYKGMIGKHAVFGTKNPEEATELTFQEFWDVCESIDNFLSCRPIFILD